MFWEEMNLPEEILLDDFEELAAAWLNGRRRIMAPKTTARRLTTMKNVARAFKIQALDEYRPPTPARPRPHPLPGGTDDIRKLLAVCNSDAHRALIVIPGLCGARITEAREVTVRSFNFSDRTLTIWGKGDKVRTVPVSEFAWDILLPILVAASVNPDAPIIEIGDRSARDQITTLGMRAGLARRISSHDLRATFATEAYRKTKDIRAVQELMGHATSKQTELYILVDEDALRSAVNIME